MSHEGIKFGRHGTISRFLYPCGRQPFVLALHCCKAPATYPEVVTERAAPPPLFGLAPRGVCPAGRIAPSAVRFYRTISPLPGPKARRYIFCGTFRKDPFERSPPAVSRHVALWRPDFPPACASGYPSRTCQCSVSHDVGCAVLDGWVLNSFRTDEIVTLPVLPSWPPWALRLSSGRGATSHATPTASSVSTL
jgi:hypothetical protein